MMTLKGLKRMAERRGFVEDEDYGADRYIFDNGWKLIVLDITEENGRFSVSYKQQPPESLRYHGRFGPKGGYRNYAARKIVERLSELPVINQKKTGK